MTPEIEIAKQCGIAYFLTPEGTTEMHGNERQIQDFAKAIAFAERQVILGKIKAREQQLDGCSSSANFSAEVLRDLHFKIRNRK